MPVLDSLERAWKRQRVDTGSFLLGVGAATSAAAAGLGIWWWVHGSKLRKNGMQSQYDMPVDDLAETSREMDSPGAMYRPLRQAETVLQRRRLDVICVLHYPAASRVQDALRVCEALGVQHVYIVDQPIPEKKSRPWEAKDAKLRRQANPAYMSCDAAAWLSIRRFTSAEDCVKALQQQRSPIWLASTAQSAQPLATAAASLSRFASHHEAPRDALSEDVPAEGQAGVGGDTVQAQPVAMRAPLAVVFAQGEPSAAYSDAAERTVYFSLSGFTQSLPSVAAMAVMLHQITALMTRQGAQQQPQSLSEEHLQLRLQWYRQLAGGDADSLKQYTDMVQQPLAPFADLRMHSNRRDDKQTAIGRPTGLGALPFGKAGQAAAPWQQQQQPTPDTLGGGQSSSQAQLANGLHSGQEGGNEETAAAAATNGDPGASSSSASPSSASPTANWWGPKSPSSARSSSGARRSSKVAGSGPFGSQRTPWESTHATVPPPKSGLSDSRASSVTGTPGARPPPAAPSVFQDRLDGGAEASRGPSSNQVTPSRRSNIAAGSPFAQLPSPGGGRAAAGSPFAQPPSPANSSRSSVTGTSGPPHSYVPWASPAVAPPDLSFKSPKPARPSSQSSSPLSQSAAYPPASRFSPTSSMNLPNEVFSPPSPGAASTASSRTTQSESADRAHRRSQVFRRQMGGQGPASHALSSAMSSNLDGVQM